MTRLMAVGGVIIALAAGRLPGTSFWNHTMLAIIDERQSWAEWQHAVVRLLRADFNEVLHHIGFDEIDWASWRSFYDEGRSPRAAIDRALERDF